MKKILLIEDEANVVNLLKRGLEEEGYDISVAMDGVSGYEMAGNHTFDLMIIDIMLPGMNGIDICRKLRQQKVTTPILMLTALGSTENIVSGLDSGADDYLVKPFNFAELLARMRTLFRRNLDSDADFQQDKVLSLADLQLNLDTKAVTRAGGALQLTATEFRLLEYLLRNKGRVLSRMDILEYVWGVDFNMSTNVVDVYINYLRKKADKDFDPKLIHTVVGMGYVLKVA
ncbi:response regulator transcription factor [Taibaiella chishuiensis]|uniref:Winged helix family two component transcriptional regulator n=1 Tax=Taibaiella chishuiensis TaxID=1434707 RepID=A0A2P8CV47_9BACT|nr:response regulator transcription factor [Taibaiella chishuiensis]PSK88835.1 winged helix family two component transcriptional regulator [Taibaiella chishuiensis]